MLNPPETRASLLLQIRDPANQSAWDEFSEIYRPLICRLGRLRGLQDSDADDLAQQVLLAVAGAVGRWEVDPDRARFRTWLKRVADNAILNALTRSRPDRGSGDERLQGLLEQRPARSDPNSDLLRIEYRRTVFQHAAQAIRPEFSGDTWDAFWRTTVDGQDIRTVAHELDRTRGSVYASRSRVMRRLQQMVETYTAVETSPPADSNVREQER